MREDWSPRSPRSASNIRRSAGGRSSSGSARGESPGPWPASASADVRGVRRPARPEPAPWNLSSALGWSAKQRSSEIFASPETLLDFVGGIFQQRGDAGR